MTVDLERQLKILPHITQVKFRLDIILVSEATAGLAGADSTLGGQDGGGTRRKEGEVPGAGGGLPEEQLEDEMYASGGGQPRIC